MSNSYVFYDDQIMDEDNVNLSIRSKAFNYGLGCFEGIRAYFDEEDEQLYTFRLKEHYDRFLNSCKVLYINIPYNCEQLCNVTIELLKKNNFKTTTYIRPVAYKGSNGLSPSLLDEDNRLAIYCTPMGKFFGKEEMSVAVTSWQRISGNAMPARTKATAAYLNSALASLEVLQNGFDEAIFLTDKGYICEGPGENIFMVKNGKLITPPPSDDILEGITRDTVMKIAKQEFGIDTVERSISRAEIYGADEVFFSGTAMEVTPIVYIDRRVIGSGKTGQITQNIKDIYMTITKGKNPKYIDYCRPVY